MNNLELFQAALGLQEPWLVVNTEFDPDKQRLDVYLDFARGARFPCPEGDEAACPVHDTTDKTWRHLDFFEHQAYLHARVPRVNCPSHGVRQVGVPWARPDAGFTLLFEALLMAMLAEMPVKAVAHVVGEHDTRLWRVLHHYVSTARESLSMEELTKVGIDETSARRRQDYITVFADLDKRRVVFATEGKTAATLGRFTKDLAEHAGSAEAITQVCCDLSNPYTTWPSCSPRRSTPSGDKKPSSAPICSPRPGTCGCTALRPCRRSRLSVWPTSPQRERR